MSPAHRMSAVLAAALLPLPVTAGTIAFDDMETAMPVASGASPYSAALDASMIEQAPYEAAEIDAQGAVAALQIAAILVVILLVLRPMPPATALLGRWRQTLAAALARSRTRATIARSPFDL